MRSASSGRRRPNVGWQAYAGLLLLLASVGGAVLLGRSGEDAFGGAVLAYASDSGGHRAIWLSDARRSTELRAGGCGGSGSYSPAWSRDGRRLAFLTVRAGQHAVCVVESTDDEGRIVFETGAKVSNVVWHPSGRQLLLARTADDGSGAVVEVSASGRRNEIVLTTGPQGFGRPAWQPDGGGFVVATAENHLQFYDRRGALTDTWAGTTDQSPAWSRDGSRLAFVREQPGGWALLVLDVRTNRLATVASSESLLFHPDWSRDDRRLAFEGYDRRSGSADIFLTEVSGKEGNARVLVGGPGDDTSPALRP